MFGGYDAAKYTGPQIPLSAGNFSLDVPLQAVSITDASGNTTEVGFYQNTIPATLDCGTPFTAFLPNETYAAIVNHLHGLGYTVLGDGDGVGPTVNCTLRNAEGSINLNFTDMRGDKMTNPYFGNTITIAVPFSELALTLNNGPSVPMSLIGASLVSAEQIQEESFLATHLYDRCTLSTPLKTLMS